MITSVHYVIAGSGASLSGDISVSLPNDSGTALVSNLPGGLYTVTLSAASADGKTMCAGSGDLTVIPRVTVPVAVTLRCQTTRDWAGVAINGSFKLCPVIETAMATSSATVIGLFDMLDVVGSAFDPEGDPITFAWTATSGAFDDPSSARTIFRCAAPGPVTLTFTVSDAACPVQVSGSFTCQPFCATRTNGARCDDQNACTRADSCLNNQCVGSDPVVCLAQDQCHLAGVCNPANGTCSNPTAPDQTPCQLPMSIAACMTGACAITSCVADFGSCNTLQSDGCETSLTTNTNCGRCAHACASGTTCQTGLCLSPPPTGLTATAGGWTIALAWNASMAATGYEVRRATSPGGPFQAIGQSAGTAFLDAAVVSGVPYSYVVAAINPEGTGAPSPAAAATAVAKQICVESNSQHQVAAYDATQSGFATPVRVLGGTAATLDFPATIASSLVTNELYVMHRGGMVGVYPLGASGAAPPLRTLAGAVLANAPSAVLFGLDVDDAGGALYAAGYVPAGRLLGLGAQTGALVRTVSGGSTLLGNAPGVVVDVAHRELLVANSGPIRRILTYDTTGPDGDIAPKRVLTTTAGGWAIAYDRTRDQILTTCNCDDRISVFPRTATGGDPPARVLQLPGGVTSVYSMLADDAADTIWVVAGVGGGSIVGLFEIPRGPSGSVDWLHAPITLPSLGHLARCN
jgi:hypothetical protein